MQKISEIIRAELEKRLQAGESLNSIATGCGVNQANLHRYLYAGADVRQSTIDAMCAYLGLVLVRGKRAKSV